MPGKSLQAVQQRWLIDAHHRRKELVLYQLDQPALAAMHYAGFAILNAKNNISLSRHHTYSI